VKRVYDPAGPSDAHCILVDRLWPRGKKKGSFPLEAWIKEVAPSNALRQWYQHDPEKWDEFRDRYFKELDSVPDSIEKLLTLAKTGDVTLLFGSKELERNNAVALKEYLEKLLNDT